MSLLSLKIAWGGHLKPNRLVIYIFTTCIISFYQSEEERQVDEHRLVYSPSLRCFCVGAVWSRGGVRHREGVGLDGFVQHCSSFFNRSYWRICAHPLVRKPVKRYECQLCMWKATITCFTFSLLTQRSRSAVKNVAGVYRNRFGGICEYYRGSSLRSLISVLILYYIKSLLSNNTRTIFAGKRLAVQTEGEKMLFSQLLWCGRSPLERRSKYTHCLSFTIVLRSLPALIWRRNRTVA